jgi:hypothetical protein
MQPASPEGITGRFRSAVIPFHDIIALTTISPSVLQESSSPVHLLPIFTAIYGLSEGIGFIAGKKRVICAGRRGFGQSIPFKNSKIACSIESIRYCF